MNSLPSNDFRPRTRRRDAFTLIELLVVTAIIGILAALLLPTFPSAKERSRRVVCNSNLRQIDLAWSMYAADNHDVLPLPQLPAGFWPTVLQPNYVSTAILVCPTDPSAGVTASAPPPANADSAPRSYLINTFVDYYATQAGLATNTANWNGSVWLLQMKQSSIVNPSATIAFGEKAAASSAYSVNIFQSPTGSYLADVAGTRHCNLAGSPTGGGANFAMSDGSIRYLPFGEDTCPINLWAVLEQWRLQEALCRPGTR
jgi:prepilin-type N-terminal cleavage/methylation domain-containing protein